MPALLVEAVRCWREARDKRQPVQSSLFVLLSRHGHGMLAPVFDRVMTLAEGVSGRRIAIGDGETLSEDETRLIDLVEAGGDRQEDEGLGASLYCAVASLRILMARSNLAPAPPVVP